MRKLTLGVVIFSLVVLLCSCSGQNKTSNENQMPSDYPTKSVHNTPNENQILSDYL